MLEHMTRDKILNASFRLFLENGYEATNVRDICKEVGIKASTMYFYFKSKQDLFFNTYDGICADYLNYIHNIDTQNDYHSLKSRLFNLFKSKIDYYASDISKRKFIFRYHLFPPEEISNEIREKYRFYTGEENKILMQIIEGNQFKNELRNKDIEEFLFEYKRLENHFVYEMIVSSIKVNDRIVNNLWEVFWNNMINQ